MTRSSLKAPLGVTILAIVGAALLPAQAQGDNAPQAVFPTLVHDFGLVDRGSKLEHEFVVRNEGTGVLEILEAKPT